MTRIVVAALIGFLGGFASIYPPTVDRPATNAKTPVKLGNFSVSLTVKDLGASRAFYEKLGFRPFPKFASEKMVIMQNDTCTIGLFEGMFPKNMLTFNPGWDRTCATLPKFTDVRELQKVLKAEGLELTLMADESSTGPASFMLNDPDGNPILIDQHVPKPAK